MKKYMKLLSLSMCTVALSSGMAFSAYAQTPQSVPNAASGADIAHGAYLVEGLGHCGACHTPRGMGFEEKGYTAADPLFLSGAVIEGWVANSLRDSTLTQDELVELLKYGVTQKKGVAGPMRDVVTESTQYLSDADLQSMAAYLVTLQKPHPEQEGRKKSKGPSKDAAAGLLYMDYCSTCHGAGGEGIPHVVPMLAGNTNVTGEDASNLIHIVRDGAHTPTLVQRPSYVMPGYKDILTEEELIGLINHLRQSWGNQAPVITSQEYQKVAK